jgi:Domain of unknown function (DUF5060)/Protein of unknown function (DUF4038)
MKIMLARLPLIFLIAAPVFGQTPCDGTPAYSPCEMVFELSAADIAAHRNPYLDVQLHVEFKSPQFHTYAMPAFWDGGHRMLVRFSPTEAGQWSYRTTSNIPSFDAKEGAFNAASSDSPGYVKAANVHHWATDNKQPHLWLGYIDDRFAFNPPQELEQKLSEAVENKFTHFRGSILGTAADHGWVYRGPDQPNTAYFDELDRRVLSIHKRGFTIDLILAHDPDYITALFPDWQARDRFIRYIVARYAAFNVTWQGLEEFEDYPSGRAVLKELGLNLKKLDPYQHPRSSNAKITSAPLLPDGWMDFVIEASMDDVVGSVEHQLYQVPFVGVTDAQHLWNTSMDGEYPEFRGEGAALCHHWFDFMADTRHWELEPYFDIDGGRSVALEEIEYVNYIQHPGAPVELSVEKHGYDVFWFNPATGEYLEGKKYHGEHFTGQAPDSSHPWILLVGREGRKESMLKSVKFDSRDVPVQELEMSPQKVPYAIVEPTGDTLAAGKPIRFSVKLTRETRATRSMMYLWTGEVAADGRGFRVLGTGSPGSFVIPPSIATNFPAVLLVHLTALNANGKAYAVDQVYQLTK